MLNKSIPTFSSTQSLGCQVLHRLTRRATFVAAVGCMLLVIILFSALKLTRRTEPRVVDLELSRRIAEQLRPDQDDLAAIGQHVFSAYFDTRATLGNRKYVRIVAVLDIKAYESDFICQFLHESGRMSFSTVARKSAIGAGMGYNNHYYKEFVLSCPIGNDTRSATFVFVQTGDAAQRSQVLRVRHNPLSLGKQPADQQQIINCVSVTFGNPNEHRLIEWLEAQRLLKMDKVELHFYHVLNKNFEAVAQSYSAEGFLNVRKIGCPFCDPADSDLKLLLMSPAINQCLYENLGGYKYTAVFDLDEIIVPQQHPDYPSMLAALEKVSTSSFAFRNWYHFNELGEDSTVDSRMHMLRHPYRTKEESQIGYSAKSIHRSCCVVALQNHFSWEDAPKPNTRMSIYHVAVDIGVNEHYKKCHFYPNECKAMTAVKDRKDGSRLKKLIGKRLKAEFRSKERQVFS